MSSTEGPLFHTFKQADMRLRYEYLALFASLVLVLLESVIHLITFCLRMWTFAHDYGREEQPLTCVQLHRSFLSAMTNRRRCSTSSLRPKRRRNVPEKNCWLPR